MSVRVGVIGIHGYSRTHLAQFLTRHAAGDCVLVAAVAYERSKDEAYASSLEAAGVRLVPDLDSLLALHVDLISVPLGIHLHVPVSGRCLRAGKAVYLEKPVAGSVEEVDHLINVEQETGLPVIVGFQDIFANATRVLKRRLLSGIVGNVKNIDIAVGWPRPKSYYARNAWAGRLKIGDAWVRDSIANNACAHFLNVALFLAGRHFENSAQPLEVTAELGRGNHIESFDTCSISTSTLDGPFVRFSASHLGMHIIEPKIRITEDRGVIENSDLEHGNPWVMPNGSHLQSVSRYDTPYVNTLAFLKGEDVPVCRLHHARPHAVVIESAHASGPINDLSGCIEKDSSIQHPRIDEALILAYQKSISLSQTGLLPGLVAFTHSP